MTVGGNSIIHTLQGDVFASDLVGLEEPTYVYTWDGARVTVGRITVEGPITQVPLRVLLDDSTEILVGDRCALLARNGSEILASDVEPETSLLPIYLKPDGDGYPLYREPGDWNRDALTQRDSWNWRRVSRMVAEWKLKRRCAPGDIVRHVDGNRRNCSPGNLSIDYRPPKGNKQKASFAEPIFKAQKIIDKLNHKVVERGVDFSREMVFIRAVEASNVGIGGVFLLADTE